MLAFPGLTLGYMTKHGEHTFATRLLGGVRWAAALVALCALGVAWILAGGFITHDPPGSGLSCVAGVNDAEVRPAPHHTWRTTRDPDRSEIDCATKPTVAGTTHVGDLARATTIAATAVAGCAALWLLLGFLYTWLRRGGNPPAPPTVASRSA